MHLPRTPAFYAQQPLGYGFILLSALLVLARIVWLVGEGRQNKVLSGEPIWTFSKPSLSDLSLQMIVMG